MIDKTRLGISFFDDRHGGVYRKRPVLCCGRHGSGKTLFALHCLQQSVQAGESALLLSSWHARDLAIVAEKALGFACEDAVNHGQAALLEYAGMMPTPDFEQSVTLPPASFMEFMQIVESRHVSRVIIDTVLPWVAIPQKDRLSMHVYSFIQALERMGVTSILTLPRPVSPMAYALRNCLEEQVPVVLTLDRDDADRRTLTVNKYLGEAVLPPPVAFEIVPGSGIVAREPAPAAGSAGESQPPGKIRFSSAFQR